MKDQINFYRSVIWIKKALVSVVSPHYVALYKAQVMIKTIILADVPYSKIYLTIKLKYDFLKHSKLTGSINDKDFI